MKNTYYFLFLFTPFFIFSQTPCTGNMSGAFPCDDYDLMDLFSKTTLSAEDGSDIWGWTDTLDGKEYAIMTFEDKTCFLDITDPVNPVYKGFLNSNAGSHFWRDVKVYNNHAFIVADNVGAHGMQVFDLKRLRSVASPPENFAADTVLTAGFDGSTIGSCHNIVINESKAKAYLVGCRSANAGGPIVIDISNPTSPVAIGQYTAEGYTHDAQVVTYDGPDPNHQGKEILIGSNESKVVILDVTTPTAITKISEVTYSSTSYTHQGWFNADKKYFLVGDEGDEQDSGNKTRTIIFDFTDLDLPTYHSQFLNTTSAIDHNLYVDGNLMYQANYSSGLRVLNIANINNITEVGYFDTNPDSEGVNFRGAWSVYPYFSSGNIIVSDTERGFFVIKKSGALGLNDVLSEDLAYTIYPNPASNELFVKKNMQTIDKIELFNVLGQRILEFPVNNQNEIKLDTSKYSDGFYFIKINDEFTKKILIKR